jgi:cytochrome c556
LEFKNQVFQVAVIFGRIKEDVDLDEMKNLIAEAKQENAKVDTSRLPEKIRENGQALNDAMDKFLAEMENVAGGSIENSDQLNEAYAEFSTKEDEFSVNSRVFINSLEDLKPLQDKIRADLAGIQKIYFKIK